MLFLVLCPLIELVVEYITMVDLKHHIKMVTFVFRSSRYLFALVIDELTRLIQDEALGVCFCKSYSFSR